MNAEFTVPLFPLSAHLLPGGRMSLRIFEPRYVRLIKEACIADTGFGICMLNSQGDKNKNEHIYPIGTYVKIIDFDLLEDGILGVTVEAQKCFKIASITTEDDDLRIGRCQWLDVWEGKPLKHTMAGLSDRLKEIFDKYPEQKLLYLNPQFNDPIWVIYRWLEIVPVNAEQKQHYLQQKDCVKALDFLTQLVE
ncbi:LON peptidase substrate-binding domain-containing protein [uncultured Paraglaciecola sp.]|uniref:LON peptidase substrate-binding domain-containing protein n=1 Tax=uncultured Paraglaciecola sp. TaxID=1765024 RepID=UPI0030DC58DF|tara:strand:- start:12169 stop:12747 length:579 start_codon:yes stop_codon:yes gene_type:complete